ncbi:MAG: UDP-N-acetylglucosamine--N-acetylmuramyl-(pentapeptide) pyrophosphoryl-undecaprenol N-acetylglucosamine transferase, partial [Chloroflexota bacterium]|nr:UDP-N-acetylglucosamine--N-acetylmuramyl-(pentapeptide) pyrophosphoryl-undecaprenol N-acetylglucosamine transferase [Chloroflexota bacterium]
AALLTTGGYVSGPVAVAAWLRRVPILLFLPDIEPGQSFRFIGRLAACIGVTVEDSRAFFPAHKVVVTGYPLRAEVTRWDRATARQALGLSAAEAVLLVFGGSQGARSINRAVLAHLAELLAEAQVVHISGRLDWEEVAAARDTLPETLRARYHPFPYLHEEMGAALASADVVVSRAGASVLGEFPYFGLPAILVPYPYAWRYQKVNAEWLARRGAALVVADKQLPERLVPTVRDLLNDEAQRAALAEAARSLAQPDAAQQLANLLLSLGKVV